MICDAVGNVMMMMMSADESFRIYSSSGLADGFLRRSRIASWIALE